MVQTAPCRVHRGLGDRKEGHAHLVSQAEHHRLGHALSPLHVPRVRRREAGRASVMVPGLIAITILFSASSIEPVSIPDRAADQDLRPAHLGPDLAARGRPRREPERVPVQPSASLSCRSSRGSSSSALPVLGIVPLAVGLLLTSFCFATMGTLFASYPTESPGDIMSMLNVVRLPLIFISGVFIPHRPDPCAWRRF